MATLGPQPLSDVRRYQSLFLLSYPHRILPQAVPRQRKLSEGDVLLFQICFQGILKATLL